MLVLARKKDQSIMIGNNIKIVVVEVSGETVRLGIEAPTEMEIYRSEIYKMLHDENAESVSSSSDALRLLEKIMGQKRN